MVNSFPSISFSGQLRPSQAEVVEIAQSQLRAGDKKLYVNAPPGSGKTVTGLYLWAELIKRPAVVLSPNSAIQSQWLARTDLFTVDGEVVPDNLLSMNPKKPALFTSLTYQSLTLPSRGGEELVKLARELWVESLMLKEQAHNAEEAWQWIEDLAKQNPDYYDQRIAFYGKKMRDVITQSDEALSTLHSSALENLELLKQVGVGLVILDECHHLVGHWGRILNSIQHHLDDPVIIGLTATPPTEDEQKNDDWETYTQLLGDIDFETPIPAVVKDGFMAPYKDLCYFVRPTSEELEFISGTSDHMQALLHELDNVAEEEDRMSLVDWTYKCLDEQLLPHGPAKNWAEFAHRTPSYSSAARVFLAEHDRDVPAGVPEVTNALRMIYHDLLSYSIPTVDRYVRLYLMKSSDAANHDLADRVKRQLRLLGVQITETGNQLCASPVNRVLAYSQSKANALVPILSREREVLGDSIRAVVVCDFEKTSAISAEVSHILDNEVGGAIAAFKTLIRDVETDELDPVLVTGQTVLVDDDLFLVFHEAASQWLQENDYEVELGWGEMEGYRLLKAKGSDWVPRVYVEMITDLFLKGYTRCLVGTRGLLGEGWDANKINVLVDLTTVTTSMSVNQLRGRSMRLDPHVKQKLANNWDVVCIAPEFLKGLSDYKRFCKKHTRIYGVTDDGMVEKGVAHVHPAFTEIKPKGIEQTTAILNDDMLSRAGDRKKNYQLWAIGKPFKSVAAKSVTVSATKTPLSMGFPPFSGQDVAWTSESFTLQVAEAVLCALRDTELIPFGNWLKLRDQLHISKQAGGYVRVFLEEAEDEEREVFTTAMSEIFSPPEKPRYLIERFVDLKKFSTKVRHPWFASVLPNFLKKYFEEKYEHVDVSRELIMIHAVPSALATKREIAEVFQRHWNEYVSPGQLIYAQREEGREFLQKAIEGGLVVDEAVETREFFR